MRALELQPRWCVATIQRNPFCSGRALVPAIFILLKAKAPGLKPGRYKVTAHCCCCTLQVLPQRPETLRSIALPRREKELQKGADAGGPGGFVVLGAFDAGVVEVAVVLPAFVEQDVAEFFDVVDDARTFAGADVQPDARAGLDGSSV